MRKKTISFGLDNIFWYLVYLLPLLCYLVFLGAGGSAPFYDFMSNTIGLHIVTDNIFITTVSSIFGSDGIVPLLDTSSSLSILAFLSYFVACYFIHFCVDILMLLPRMLMRSMDKLSGGC